MNLLILLAITALTAYLIRRLTGWLEIPTVTGYVLLGVVLGVSMLRIFHEETLQHLDLVNDLALGLIGFTIGSELRREIFQKLGKPIFLIALFESFCAFILVTLVIFILDPSRIYLALILGAVASATAPAATVYVIQQYKTKGPLTSTILAVVGIDDAIALMIFVFAAAMTKSVLSTEHLSAMHIILTPFYEISLSMILGIVLGLLFVWLFRKVRFPDDLSLGVIGFILLGLGISEHFHLSGLLAIMAFGAVSSNMNLMLNNRSGKVLEQFSPILYACFFIFGGAHLNLALLPKVGILGLVYLITRMAGKMGGATLGAWIGRAPSTVKKYIGFALIPQVGVAIALAILVNKEFGTGKFGEPGMQLADVVINVLLFTTIVTEIVGPVLTKVALTRAGERNPD